jgi:hypothetical protein
MTNSVSQNPEVRSFSRAHPTGVMTLLIGNVLVPNSSQTSKHSCSPRPNPSPASLALKATGLGTLQDGEEDFFAQLPEITPDMTRAMDAIEASDTLHRLSAKNVPRKDRAAKFLVIPFVLYL